MEQQTTEIERTFLAKFLPRLLPQMSAIDLQDIYIPFSDPHPHMRLRKEGQKYTLTKKIQPNIADASVQHEISLPLNQAEYDELQTVRGKRIVKRRYYIPVEGKIAEFDVFFAELAGLALIDFEFPTELERDNFMPPDFCLVEVTNDEWFAGGFLAGKTYAELEPHLKQYNYTKLVFEQ